MDDGPDRPSLGGWYVPKLSTVVTVVVAGSIVGYFVYGRAIANLFAIGGAVVVTAVAVLWDRFEKGRPEQE